MITKPIRERLDQEKLSVLIDDGFTWATIGRFEKPAKILFFSSHYVAIEFPEAPESEFFIGYLSIRAVHKPIEEDEMP